MAPTQAAKMTMVSIRSVRSRACRRARFHVVQFGSPLEERRWLLCGRIAMFATVGWATLLGKEGAAYLKPCMQPRTALEDTQVVSSDETKEDRSDRDASGSAAGTCVESDATGQAHN